MLLQQILFSMMFSNPVLQALLFNKECANVICEGPFMQCILNLIFLKDPARLLGTFAPLLVCTILRKVPACSFIRHIFSLLVQLLLPKSPPCSFIRHICTPARLHNFKKSPCLLVYQAYFLPAHLAIFAKKSPLLVYQDLLV